jgi:hypothetical protein
MGQLTQTTPQVQAILDAKMGWQDFNDLATTSSPIDLAVAGTFYPLTNDGAGGFTNTTYKIADHGLIWDTVADAFDFTDLALGDTVDFRLDFTVTVAANTQITTRMALGTGGGAYTLQVDNAFFKTAGTYQITNWYSIYMGDANTRDNGGVFEVSTDGTNDDLVVNGWYVRTQEQ